MMKRIICTILAALTICCSAAIASDFASSITGYSNLGTDSYIIGGNTVYPYSDANSALGQPSTWIQDPGLFGDVAGTYACSMVCGACWFDPSGNKLVTTIQQNGYLVLGFDQPVYDDPLNWYDKDFIVFGNSAFTGSGGVRPNTDMSSFKVLSGTVGSWEPMSVSVAQYPNGPWYTYSSGPYADDYAPTQSFAWDWVNKTWGPQLDFTRPVDPSFTESSFTNITVASAIDKYKGSGGGTAFNLADLLTLPVLNSPGDPNNGRKWMQYVKISANHQDQFGTVNEGEVDAVARVSHRLSQVTVGQAKLLGDGAHVVLNPAWVSAGTNEVGAYCYIEQPDRSAGIKVLGRLLTRSSTVSLWGDVSTVGGERVILATAAQVSAPNTVMPVGISNKSMVGAQGLSSVGLLLGTWGKITSVNTSSRTFIINDGSGTLLTCVAPAVLDLSQLTQGKYVRACGVSSRQTQQSPPVLLLRDQTDLEVMAN